MQERPRDKWPGPDEKQTVVQMLTDPYCDHWNECHQFLERVIQLSRLPVDMQEDVIQNAVLSVVRNLSTFRFDCKFSTWLVYVARSRITDAQRDLNRYKKQFIAQSEAPYNEENETDTFTIEAQHTTEEECIIRENISEAMKALQEYVSAHSKPARNRQILQKIMLDQYTYEEAAKELGVNAPVIRYIVHAAQRAVHERFDNHSSKAGPTPW